MNTVVRLIFFYTCPTQQGLESQIVGPPLPHNRARTSHTRHKSTYLWFGNSTTHPHSSPVHALTGLGCCLYIVVFVAAAGATSDAAILLYRSFSALTLRVASLRTERSHYANDRQCEQLGARRPSSRRSWPAYLGSDAPLQQNTMHSTQFRSTSGVGLIISRRRHDSTGAHSRQQRTVS